MLSAPNRLSDGALKLRMKFGNGRAFTALAKEDQPAAQEALLRP
jgi:hypothetical protein